MDTTLQILLTFSGLLIPLVVAGFARDRALNNRISNAEQLAMRAGFEAREHASSMYVRRDDFKDLAQRIEANTADMRREMSAMNQTLAKILQRSEVNT